MSIFAPLLAVIDNEGMRSMIQSKLDAAVALVKQNNKDVRAINAAKATDPNNTEYLDLRIQEVVKDDEINDPELKRDEARFQKLTDEREKLLAKMRKHVKENHLRAALSEEAVQALRKSVNDGKDTIKTAITAAESFATMADMLLTQAGKPVEGGILSMIPQQDSLMNVRGRKASASSSSSEGYATKVDDIFLNGKSTNKTVTRNGEKVVRAHFENAADELGRMFNGERFEGNKVTKLEVEEQYYAKAGKTFRDKAAMPIEYEFTFEKDIQVQSTNDDSTKVEPQKVLVKVIRKPLESELASETEEAKTEGVKTEEAKPSE